MKKIISASTLALSLFVNPLIVHAANPAYSAAQRKDADDMNFGSELEINKERDSHYTVILPESIKFNTNERQGSFAVVVQELGLKDNQYLEVKMTGKSNIGDGFYLVNENRMDLNDRTKSPQYFVSSEGMQINSGDIACNFTTPNGIQGAVNNHPVNYNDDNTSVDFDINFQIDDKLPGGTYKGSIEFNIAVKTDNPALGGHVGGGDDDAPPPDVYARLIRSADFHPGARYGSIPGVYSELFGGHNSNRIGSSNDGSESSSFILSSDDAEVPSVLGSFGSHNSNSSGHIPEVPSVLGSSNDGPMSSSFELSSDEEGQ